MKHVDRKKLKREPAALTSDELSDVIEHMEQGFVIWDANACCRLITPRVYEFFGLDSAAFGVGQNRERFLGSAVEKGQMSEKRRLEVEEKFASGEAFSFTRRGVNKRVILTNVRPLRDKGHVVTFSDVTAFTEAELDIARARSKAEAAEVRLKEELTRLQADHEQAVEREADLKRLSLVAAHAKDLIVISDAANRIVWANEAYRAHNNLVFEFDLRGKNARDVLVGPKTDAETLAQIDEAVRQRQAVAVEVLCYRRAQDGSRDTDSYWMEQEIIPVFDENGAHTNFILVGRDVTERRAAQREAEAARRFERDKRDESRLLAEFNEWLQSSDNLDELFKVVSQFLSKLLPGSSGAVYVYGASRDVLEAACSWPDDGALTHFEPADCWGLRRGRSYFYGANTVDFPCSHVRDQHGTALPDRYYCMPIVAHGDTVGLLHVVFADDDRRDTADIQKLAIFCAEQISLAIANVRLREQLREQSTRDPLTGLYNRRYFLDYARREIARADKAGKPAALISLDVDHFKKFNDTYGHDAGDEVLKTLASILSKLFRTVDVPCRLGGEEFVVMLPGAGEERAMERAEVLRAEIEAAELRYQGETLKITASLGVAIHPEDGNGLQAIMQAADDALYVAKKNGRNRIERAKH